MTDHDTDSPVPLVVLTDGWELAARRRFLAKYTQATLDWLDDSGPMPTEESCCDA